MEVFRYVTQGSFDSYMWQTLETKARFIAQVMKGDKGLRSLEDVELAALSYAEVKALVSGNPLVIEKAGVDAEVIKLSTLFSVWRNQRWDNKREVVNLPLMIEALERKAELIAQDVAAVEPQSMVALAIEVDGGRLVGADAIGDALRNTVKTMRAGHRRGDAWVERRIGRFSGFELGIGGARGDEVPGLFLAGRCRYEARPYQTGPGLVSALLAALESVAEQHAKTTQQVSAKRKRLADLQLEMERPFDHELRLTELLARQRELLKALDLDKDEAGTGRADMEESRREAA